MSFWVEHVAWLLLVGVGLAGIAANLLVLITIRFFSLLFLNQFNIVSRCEASLQTVANICVQSLCMVDLLYSSIGLPVMIAIYHWDTIEDDLEGDLVDDTVFNPLWCLPNFFFSCSLHHVLLLTVDRFTAIIRPLSYSISVVTKKSFIFTTIATIWIANAVWYFGPLLIIDLTCFYHSTTKRIIHNITIAILWILPIVVILVMYISIVYEVFLRKRCRVGDLGGSPSRVQLRGAVTIFWIVLIFLLTCLPNSIYSFLHYLDDKGKLFGLSADTQRILSISTSLFKATNCFLNPLIYFIRMKRFKTTLLFRLWKRSTSTIKVATTDLDFNKI